MCHRTITITGKKRIPECARGRARLGLAPPSRSNTLASQPAPQQSGSQLAILPRVSRQREAYQTHRSSGGLRTRAECTEAHRSRRLGFGSVPFATCDFQVGPGRLGGRPFAAGATSVQYASSMGSLFACRGANHAASAGDIAARRAGLSEREF